MRQTNKVDASALSTIYEGCSEIPVTCLTVGNGDNKLRIEVKYRLNADETAMVVDRVCGGVVDSETGSFRPDLKDYFLRLAVLETYTNLTVAEGAGSWNVAYGTPVFAMVTGHYKRPVIFGGIEYDDNDVIDLEQYEQILSAIDQKIEHLLEQSRLNSTVNELIVAMTSFRGADSLERGGRFYAS